MIKRKVLVRKLIGRSAAERRQGVFAILPGSFQLSCQAF